MPFTGFKILLVELTLFFSFFPQIENDKKNSAERPKTLAVGDSKSDMDKYKTDPQYATTYMEIPQRDEGSESSTPTKPVSPSNFQKNGERTPSGEDLRHNHDIHTPPEKDVGPGKDKAPAEAPMAFTVDLGDDIGGAPKLNMKHSLSEFLPHKVRKSFRSRSIKSRRNSEDKEEVSLFIAFIYFFLSPVFSHFSPLPWSLIRKCTHIGFNYHKSIYYLNNMKTKKARTIINIQEILNEKITYIVFFFIFIGTCIFLTINLPNPMVILL